ncbi:Ankyrin repeat domain-containing 50 [Paramuricea clavata]|uniref:Ankyrin repeat domain-containing 50 n=1 Tax=Paramuricea clavata TaxID=317549 RepID=A0A6S7FLX9_PARCT|nr:Ankyrin repeat domain-containing 50 [Paramuricea clavata]
MRGEKKRFNWFVAITAVVIIVLLLLIIAFLGVIYTRLPNGNTPVKNDSVTTWKNTSNPVFVGRHWLFRQLEYLFQKNDNINGVLLVGDPGSGYKKLIQNKDIQNILDKCMNDPIECAKVTVFEPLLALNIPSETKKFILIDALDECREKKGSSNVITDILHSLKPCLSSWVKLLLTSRNETTITGKISEIGVKTVAINATSKENLDDIRSFAQEIISRYGESLKEKLNESIETILNRTDGNFLFIKMLLEDFLKDSDKVDLTSSFPSNMSYVYARSFRVRFGKNELKRFAKFFEVLLASNLPPTIQLLRGILTLNAQIDDHELDDVSDKLYMYLRLDNGTVRIFHQSFAEWLTDHDTPIDGFSIKKSRGHQYIANYFFDHYNEEGNDLTVEGLYELSMHVLNGEMLNKHKYVSKLKGLNSNVTDRHGKCILHYLARNRESTKVLEVFIQQFKSVDILDLYYTPAYYATIAGNFDNLKLFIKNGADVNYVTTLDDGCSVFSLVIDHSYHDRHSLTFIAAYKGYRKIVELLMNNGAHIDKEDNCGWKPLYAAVKAGRLKIAELLINKTDRTSSDLFALHLAALFDHSDVLKFLLKNGVRDKCIPCKGFKPDFRDGSLESWSLTTHQYFETICGSVLNIAVSRRNLKIVEILLSHGKETLECKSLAGLTPLMRAVEKNDTKMVTLLLDEGADVEAQCEISRWNQYLIIFGSHYYCSYTSKAIHISVKQGTSKITAELIKRNANRFSLSDCIGLSSDDLTAILNQEVNTSPLSKTVMRYSAVCGSVKTFKLLSRNKSVVVTTIYEDGMMTLLHLATMFHDQLPCTAFKCSNKLSRHNYVDEKKYLKTIKLLTKVAPQNINKKDKHGRTALHYAALVRSPDVVKHLIRKGSDWKIKDENGNTALKFVQKRPIDYINLGPCSTVIYSLLNSSEMAISNEMHVNCLRKLRVRTLNIDCELESTIVRIVELMAYHNLSLSWYTLFKIDADLYCLSHENSDESQYRAMNTISELLKVIELDVKLNCEFPFEYSILHVMAVLLDPIRVGNNYFSALAERYVNTYSMESPFIDECYDAEGLLPIHYAASGNNIDMIDLFMNHGVDIWKKTRSGWTAFDLSIINGQCSPRILDKLLNHITSNKEYKVPSGSDFWCNTTNAPFSLLHIAAINGLECLRYIHENTFIPISRLPFNSCTNRHGINLLYLLKLYHDVEWTTEWNDLGLPTHTTLSKYPERDAKYHLVYNYFFLTPFLQLDKSKVNVLDLFRCPGINDFLPHGHVIEKQIKRCHNRCWHSASHASCDFSCTFRTVMFDPRHSDGFIGIVPQMAKLRYHCVKMFYNVSTTLWRQVSKAYTCSHKCRCLEIMRLLQKEFTSKPRRFRVGRRFLAERMGWNNTSFYDNIEYHWPFGFLLKKALKMDEEYEYLKILTHRET